MSKLYEKVFSTGQELYAAGCPVIIAAGALQKNTKSNKVYAQLKFRNIGTADIKALKLSLNTFDSASEPVNKGFDYQYLDCNAKRDGEFGQRTLIELPDASVRSFEAEITEILFEDGILLSERFSGFSAFPEKVSLKDALGEELYSQYIRDVGAGAEYKPFVCGDLWVCTCGTLNRQDEEKCHSCEREKEVQLEALDTDKLKEKKEAAEKALKAEQERKELERAAEAKKKRMKVSVTLAVICAIVFGIVFAVNYADKSDRYNQAVALIEESKYDSAKKMFEELGSFKDSEEQVLNTDYIHAKVYLEDNDYEEGFELLKKLGDYKDCKELLSEAQANLYEKADTLLETGKDHNDVKKAFEHFNLLKDYEYKDSGEKLETVRLQYMVNTTWDSKNGDAYFSANKNEFKEITAKQAKKMLKGKWIELNTYHNTYKNLQDTTLKYLDDYAIRKVNEDIIAYYGTYYFSGLLVRKDSEWGKRYLNVTLGKYEDVVASKNKK